MLGIIVGLLLIMLSIYQFYATSRSFKSLKKGNYTDPSPFMLPTLWTSTIIAIFLAIAGIGTIIILK
ncbi:hypothetical protein [Companilactobacillus bobalius]|uniref:Immunity protein n=1 Tax=Companilactobacillus bobalius DSM 19674 TaxID=1423788 RepID=A0A0R1KDR5_9LACO|nr:hypothetical protein [Companilactobacillus bobalius]KAE9562553.1 hypothetical protein ATN92_04500 [Companilactobacillus bobalius]KRK81548.1 hypothetical protein FC78_GL000601 [Companilactobacillus bobalius DSM 19674]GEO57767.1 hypothetical protein LBO01_08960 [Companilactobacillus paralimentarius]